MQELFGIPVGSLAVALLAVLAAAVGVVAAVAVRNRGFVRLGLRNAGRRRGRGALIVAGLMLGTAIVAAALATGDTMSHTIRSSATAALGPTDEVVAAKGIEAALQLGASGATGAHWFPASYADRLERSLAPSGLVRAVEPVIVEDVAVQDVTSAQNEPRVTLFATDPARTAGFGQIRSDGRVLTLADLGPGEVYLNRRAADDLGARAGDTVRILAGERLVTARVKAVVSYRGSGTDGDGVMLPLASAQRLLGKPGLVKGIFVSNVGGVGATDAVMRVLTPAAAALGLEADNTKQDALRAADSAGAAFMSFFTTFGSFSIAAGLLLIFLIFVMLAAERRGELGIARAIGTRRGHVVQMFLYEGLAYDLLAAAVGVLVGVAVAYGMTLVMAHAFETQGDFHIGYSVRPASMLVAYAIGVLLTFAVVVLSSWRVSRMSVASAIRNLPEPPLERARRRRWVLGAAGLLLGIPLVASGLSAKDGVTLGFGVLVVVLSLVPIARALGAPERAAHTGAGLALVVWFVLPIGNWLFGPMKVNFSIFVLGGLAIVIGATWTIVYNADVLLGAVGATLGRIRGLAPVLRMAMAYPLRGLFRTGVTLAMFTLVVFTLVVGSTTTGSFVNAANDLSSFGGGFDVSATSAPASPILDMRSALARAPGLDPADFTVVSSRSLLPVEARQLGTDRAEENYAVHGVDTAFLDHTTYGMAATADGYPTAAAVWQAVREQPGLAVIDSLVVPRKANWGFGAASTFTVSGFYLEDKTFSPFSVLVRDPQTGRTLKLTVIGVLPDSAPQTMLGLWTSQATLDRAFGDRVQPTGYLFELRSGVDPAATARKLESAFLADGMQADSIQKLLGDAVSGSLTFNRLMEGFMGLGLIVGVAALGVITARAVAERRQQIGILRAIGFQRRMIQLSFLVESSFVALTAIVIGTALGLAVSYNVLRDAQGTPSWSNLTFDVPWATLGVIFLAVYTVALATTFVPARRAARVYPAEALRYQ